MKKPASKVAEPAQIQPKSQFLLHKNLPPRDFSLMTLSASASDIFCCVNVFKKVSSKTQNGFLERVCGQEFGTNVLGQHDIY